MKKILVVIGLLSLVIFSSSCAALRHRVDFSSSSQESSSQSGEEFVSVSTNAPASGSTDASSIPKRFTSSDTTFVICYSFEQMDRYRVVLSDDKKTLIRDHLEWLVAPKGFSFSENFITDTVTMYIKILDDKDKNHFRWVRACFLHEKCKLNGSVDLNLSQMDNKQFTYAQGYTFYTDDDFTFKTERCDFVNEYLTTYVNVSAIESENVVDDYISLGKALEKGEDIGIFVPFSYKINGKQQLTKFTNIFYDTIQAPAGHQNFKRVGIEGAFTSNSDKYNNILIGKGEIEYNGNWDLFPSKMLYKKYDIDNQPTRRDWNKAIKKEFENQDSSNTAVVIAESWEFNLGDKKCSVVNADNILLTDYGFTIKYIEGKKTFCDVDRSQKVVENISLPADENALLYKMSILFVEGQPPRTLFSDYEKVEYSVINDKDFYDFYYVYQYNDKNELVLCKTNIDCAEFRDYKYSNSFLVCDTDGDGLVELLGAHESGHSLYVVYLKYEFIDGKVVQTY